jgi:hypothetical protein
MRATLKAIGSFQPLTFKEYTLMATTNMPTQAVYRQEYIDAFERDFSDLRQACTTEANIQGQSAIFLVAGSGGATATTRGANGLIPARQNVNEQFTCSLTQLHDLVEGQAFNWDLSQGNQRQIAMKSSAKVIHRAQDDQILTALSAATQADSAASTANLKKVLDARNYLGNQNVMVDEADNMFGLVSWSFLGYLQAMPEFSSRDYVDMQPFSGPAKRYLRWSGINWIATSAISGVGTSSETCYLFHRSAIGHATALGDMQVEAGWDGKQATYWQRASTYAGAKLLQNTGVYKWLHDGS